MWPPADGIDVPKWICEDAEKRAVMWKSIAVEHQR
jgi:hypothetical protein